MERASAPSRQRYAISMFMIGRSAPCDRLIASLYFSVAARQWSSYGEVASHTAPLAEGLKSCRSAKRALDIGTGAGSSAALVADRDPATEVVAVDASRRMLREARRRYQRPNLTFERTSMMRLPFRAAWFELVTLLNAVPELGELRRVCAHQAEVLVASTVFPVREELSAWVGRWHEAGFTRVRSGAVRSGSWEVFTPR
jgi:ubiquinone/menaquinone biosynthesis C-methylase UbiE